MRDGASRNGNARTGTGRMVSGLAMSGVLGCALIGTLVGLSAPASAATLEVGISQGTSAEVKVTTPPVKLPVKTPAVSTPATPSVPTATPTVPATPKPAVPSVDKPRTPAPDQPAVEVDVDPTTGVGITIGGPDRGSPAADRPQGISAPSPSSDPAVAVVSASNGTAVRGHRRHAERVVALESGITGDGEGVTGSAESGGETGTISEQLVSAAHTIGPANGGVLLLIGGGWVAWTLMQRRRRLARERARAQDNSTFLAGVDADLSPDARADLASDLVRREPVAVR